MFPSLSRAALRDPMLIFAALLMAAFGLVALAAPFDHDESQYVAGAWFSSRMLIYRDFLYLQPPLHAWAFAPLVWLFPTHMVLAMRLATAACAAATLLLLWRTQRIAGISKGNAAVAALLIGTTAAFQFSGSVVRNDMLPTLLATAGMLAMLRGLRESHGRCWMAAGLCFGLAISAKLNFIPVGAAAFGFLLFGRHWKALAGLAAGGLAGLAPMIFAWAMAPEAFFYGVIRFAATGPFAWYAANGAGDELAMTEKLWDLTKYLWGGPALAVLLLIGGHLWIRRRDQRPPAYRLSLWLAGGGLIGAVLPTPSQIQYIMPLLPPLGLALGYLLEEAGRWRTMLIGLLILTAVPGMTQTSRHVATMIRHGAPVLQAEVHAHWMGAQVRALTGGNRIASLSPHLLADSGLELDRRFATGPFVYRTGWTVDPALARRMHVMIPATLADMDSDPPAAILTGYEGGTRKLPLRPDDGLIAYARRRSYRMLPVPDGIGSLYIRPSRNRPPRISR